MDTISNSKLVRVAPVRIFEQAVEQIRILIADGSFPPGTKLPTEQELVRQLNVSRSSAREALRVLEADGLIEVIHGSGTYVARNPQLRSYDRALTKWLEEREESLEQVLQVRESLEGLTAALAASMASQASLEEIRSIVEAQLKIVQGPTEGGDASIDELARLDASFHLAISRASGNEIAGEIIAHIIPSFTEGNKALLFVFQRVRRMEREHRRILDALEAGDPAASEKAMRAHISRVRKEVMAFKREGANAEK